MARRHSTRSEGGSSRPSNLATVSEVAAFLRVPVKTLYRWRYVGKGPCAYRVGRHLRFRWEEVELWLATRGDEGADFRSAKGER